MRGWTSLAFAWACLLLALGVGPAAPWLAGLLCVVGFVGGVILLPSQSRRRSGVARRAGKASPPTSGANPRPEAPTRD